MLLTNQQLAADVPKSGASKVIYDAAVPGLLFWFGTSSCFDVGTGMRLLNIDVLNQKAQTTPSK